MTDQIKVISAVFGICVLCAVPMYFIISSDQRCDEKVKLDNGTEYNCREVDSYENGMSNIRFCDGTRLKVPTRRIISIEDIETNE